MHGPKRSIMKGCHFKLPCCLARSVGDLRAARSVQQCPGHPVPEGFKVCSIMFCRKGFSMDAKCTELLSEVMMLVVIICLYSYRPLCGPFACKMCTLGRGWDGLVSFEYLSRIQYKSSTFSVFSFGNRRAALILPPSCKLEPTSLVPRDAIGRLSLVPLDLLLWLIYYNDMFSYN